MLELSSKDDELEEKAALDWPWQAPSKVAMMRQVRLFSFFISYCYLRNLEGWM